MGSFTYVTASNVV